MRWSAAAAAGALLALSLPAAADEADASRSPPSIVVEGEASRSLAPDMAIVSVGVTTERPTAGDAATVNAAAAASVIVTAKASGLAPADMSTTDASLAPVYDAGKNGEQGRIRAFRAVNTLALKVRRLEMLGDLVGRLIDKGANTLDGIAFTIADPQPVRDELRGEAMRNAQHRAGIYAGAIGLKLGHVLSIRPGSSIEPRAVPYLKMAMPAPAPALPAEAGTQVLEEHVTVTWSVEPGS